MACCRTPDFVTRHGVSNGMARKVSCLAAAICTYRICLYNVLERCMYVDSYVQNIYVAPTRTNGDAELFRNHNTLMLSITMYFCVCLAVLSSLLHIHTYICVVERLHKNT
jgi:hypothetical protein